MASAHLRPGSCGCGRAGRAETAKRQLSEVQMRVVRLCAGARRRPPALPPVSLLLASPRPTVSPPYPPPLPPSHGPPHPRPPRPARHPRTPPRLGFGPPGRCPRRRVRRRLQALGVGRDGWPRGPSSASLPPSFASLLAGLRVLLADALLVHLALLSRSPLVPTSDRPLYRAALVPPRVLLACRR